MVSSLDDVLEAAKEIAWSNLGDRTLCDACLGRLLGKAGHGLTNPERGRAVRERFRLPAADPCWVCRGLMAEIGEFATLVEGRLKSLEFATFLVGSRVDAEIVAREEALWRELVATHAEAIKSEVNREIGKRVAERMGKEPDFAHPDVVVIVETAFGTVEVKVNPLFLRGRFHPSPISVFTLRK